MAKLGSFWQFPRPAPSPWRRFMSTMVVAKNRRDGMSKRMSSTTLSITRGSCETKMLE